MIAKRNIIATVIFVLSVTPIVSARTKWKVVSTQQDIILQEMDTCFDSDRLKQLTAQLYQLSRQHPDDKVLMWRAILANAQIDKSNSQRLLAIANNMIDRDHYEYDYNRYLLLKNMTMPASDINNYKQLRKLQDYFSQEGDSVMLGRVYVHIGGIFMHLNDYTKALTYINNADGIFSRQGPNYARLHNLLNKATLLGYQGRKADAYRLLQGLTSAIHPTEKGFLANVYCAMYTFGRNQQQKDQASRKAVDLTRDVANPNLRSLCLLNRAEYLNHYGSADSARIYGEKALALAATTSDLQLKANILRTLSQAYHRLNDAERAFDCLDEANRIGDSLNSASAHIGEAEERANIYAYEREMERQHSEAIWRMWIIICISVVALVLAIGFGVRYFRRWRENHNKVKETDERNRQLQTQIDDQDRQLTTTALKLEEKRKVLHGIDTKMALARKEGTLDAATMQELRRMIKSHAAENDWNTFETYFNHSYPNLLKRLHQQYPDITEAELRHCSYVRMGLDIKETAHILNVQPDSVRKARQRLRHKLGINDPQSRLIDFLRSFEEHLED